MSRYGLVPEPTEEELWEWERSDAAFEAAVGDPDFHDPWLALLEEVPDVEAL